MAKSLAEFVGVGKPGCWVCNLDKDDESAEGDLRHQVEEGVRSGLGISRISSWLWAEYNIKVSKTTAGRNHLETHMREHAKQTENPS